MKRIGDWAIDTGREGRWRYTTTRTRRVQTKILGLTVDVQGFIQLTADGRLAVFPGYSYDGPSGPSIHTPSFMLGSLFHDALYQLMRDLLIPCHVRLLADQLLREVCLEQGMWKSRAWWVYRAARLFAAEAAGC